MQWSLGNGSGPGNRTSSRGKRKPLCHRDTGTNATSFDNQRKKAHKSFQLSFLGNCSFCMSTLIAFTPSFCEYLFRDISEIIIFYPFGEATIDLKGKETHCKLIIAFKALSRNETL